MSFPTLQLPLNGLSDQIRAAFAVGQNAVHAVKSALRKRSLHFLGPKFLSSHTNYFPYGLLTVDNSYGI